MRIIWCTRSNTNTWSISVLIDQIQYQHMISVFLEVIALAIILLVVGHVVPCVLVVTLTTIMALIVLMMIVRLAIVVITSVALMVIVVFVTAMLIIAWFMAMRGRKMSRFPFLWLLLVLGNLLKNASHLVGCLTLLKGGNHSESAESKSLTWNQGVCMQGSTQRQIEPGRVQHDW